MILTKRRFSLFRMVVLGAILILLLSITLIPTGAAPSDDLIITGLIDGPLTGGIPKAVELYAVNAIPDLSIYGIGLANNGGGSDGIEFTFPADSVPAGSCIYVATDSTSFNTFFGFDPSYTDSDATANNGDDAFELFTNGTVTDVFGDINTDGTGQPWEYLDGWAYRNAGTGPDGSTFAIGNWSFSGPNALDGETMNGTATTPFPLGTYSPCTVFTPGAPPPPPPASGLVINELNADPAGDLTGDANGDGVSHFGDDEFIELVNNSGGILDVSGWTLSDGFSVRHTFPGGTVLPDQCAIVVFGGGTPTGAFGSALVQSASSGSLGLNNGGDTVTVNDGFSDVVSYIYGGEGGDNQSLTRDPDLTGADPLVKHSTATGSGGALFSPGTKIDGSAFGDCSPVEAPEVFINELRISGSPDAEYFELQGSPGTSLDGLTYVVLSGEFSPGQIDDVIDLTGYSMPADGFFVAANSTASSSYGITPDLSDSLTFFGSPTTHMVVSGFTGSAGDDLDSNNDGALDATPWTVVVDSVSVIDGDGNTDYSYSSVIVGPDGSFTPAGTYRCEDAPTGSFDNNQLAFSTLNGTPGESNASLCVLPITKIHDVQGAGSASPLVGQTVAIEGIVVGDFQDDVGANGDMNGFFVQEEDADADGDLATSEGIFVFQGSNPAVDVAMGDHVRVEGPVSEFFGMTQITSFSDVTVISTGNPLPAASVVTLPVTAVSDFEAFEGMYVTFPQELVISEFFNFDRFGEIVLTTDRQFQPTAVFEPGSVDAANLAEANALSRITLDDGRTASNPDPAIHPNGLEFDLTNLFRGGDTVSDVTGVINYAFNLYRVQPTQGANYTAVNLRSATPDPVDGNVTVASFNVLNYFTTLDAIQDSSDNNDPADDVCGPLADTECRGADNANEFTRQRAKIIAALEAMDADVVGLIEIENHPTDAALADLVSGLNDFMGAGTYDYVATGPVGPDVIRVAFIYKPASVSPLGSFAVLDTSAFLDPNNLGSPKNRAALAQTFSVNSTGGVFTAVINHFKSKGSGCGAGDDHPEAGSCNLTRTLAAQELLNWLATDPTSSFDEDFVILGDLNAYDKEDPIDVLVAGGYTDLALYFEGEHAYSYVFNGQLGYLDYALSNAALLDEVTNVTEWHINTDEADLIDYDTSFKKAAQDAIYAPDAYRSSDHDPVLVGMELTTEAEIFEMMGVVEGLVEDGVLNNGQGNSLLSKLENILAKLGEGKTKAAVNQLGAFINELESFIAEGVLTPEQAAPLIQSAEVIVAALGD